MAQLLIHSFSSHIFSQEMDCATAATVSAGTAGWGTLVRSGWERSTEGGDTAVRRQEAWLPGATRSTAQENHWSRKWNELNMDVIIINIQYLIVLVTKDPYKTEHCRCKINILPCNL